MGRAQAAKWVGKIGVVVARRQNRVLSSHHAHKRCSDALAARVCGVEPHLASLPCSFEISAPFPVRRASRRAMEWWVEIEVREGIDEFIDHCEAYSEAWRA